MTGVKLFEEEKKPLAGRSAMDGARAGVATLFQNTWPNLRHWPRFGSVDLFVTLNTDLSHTSFVSLAVLFFFSKLQSFLHVIFF